MSADPPQQHGLSGRVALVTGASGGIGAAICSRLAGAGAVIAVSYASSYAAAEQLVGALRGNGVRAAAFAADMASAAAPGELVEAVAQELGPIDLLVANHGLGRRRSFEELTAQEWDRTLAVNLRAPFLLAQAVLPGMCERGFGRVLFTSSTAAFRGGVLAPDYAASKAGLHGLTHFLASRVANRGVTVNALAPGFVKTGMLPGDAEELGARVPVGRVGTPEEVASLALAVLENGYMTSSVVSINGGAFPH
jgi:3-oxoacyl-[acyl-carrier protein] reductase